MTVRVIGVTRPVIEELETSGQMLAYCARGDDNGLAVVMPLRF